jgi:hypothetical protein
MPANLVLSVITIIFSLFFLYHATQLPPSRSAASLGPAFWPTAVLIVMLVMGVILLIRTIRHMRQSDAVADPSPAAELEELGVHVPVEEEVTPPQALRHRHWVMVALLAVYVLVMNYAGFLVSTILYLAASAWVLGLRRVVPLTLTSVISTVVIVYLFSSILSVPLPRGVGVFQTISQLIG